MKTMVFFRMTIIIVIIVVVVVISISMAKDNDIHHDDTCPYDSVWLDRIRSCSKSTSVFDKWDAFALAKVDEWMKDQSPVYVYLTPRFFFL